MTIGERLLLIRKNHAKLSQEEFGARIALSKFSISNYETGKQNITDRVIADVCREFNVNEAWLRTGEGEIVSPSVEFDVALLSGIMTGSDEFAKSLFRSFAKLGADEWEALRKLVMSLQTGIEKTTLQPVVTSSQVEKEVPSFFQPTRGTGRIHTTSSPIMPLRTEAADKLAGYGSDSSQKQKKAARKFADSDFTEEDYARDHATSAELTELARGLGYSDEAEQEEGS